MRVVSLVPSATEIAFALGAGDQLVGVTHDCDYPEAAARLARVTSSTIPPGSSSREIDDAVREAGEREETTFHLDAAALAAMRPDVILGQTLCRVCAVTLDAVPRAGAPTVPLEATTLPEVFDDIRRVGDALGRGAAARDLIASLEARMAGIERAASPRVACIEWLDPPFNAGHWVSEQIALAGGVDVLGKPGERSRTLTWDEVRAARPDIVVLVPCGWSIERALPEATALVPDLRVPVWLMDGNAYFSRPGPRLIDGVEHLAALLRGELDGAAVRIA